MFVLAVLKDSVKVHPSVFDRNQIEALGEEIDHKYSNKVILDVGLCVCLYDFEKIGDAFIYPLDGSAHYKVTFRLVVFRPFVGEIITGTIVSQTKDGVRVSVGFSDDIMIPSYLLQAPSSFNQEEQLWSWKYSEDSEDFVMDNMEKIRFRVRSLNFTQVKATARGLQATTVSTSVDKGPPPELLSFSDANAPLMRRRSSSIDVLHAEEAPSAMQIMGSINEDGLGLISWWS